jgi:hypothetical protein
MGATDQNRRIAVVGSGISGLSAAWLLHRFDAIPCDALFNSLTHLVEKGSKYWAQLARVPPPVAGCSVAPWSINCPSCIMSSSHCLDLPIPELHVPVKAATVQRYRS